jgi:hypothetical protein
LTIIHKNKYYNKLSNDILAKLTGCKNDIDKFGPSYLTSIDSLSKEDIKGFKYSKVSDKKCIDAGRILSKVFIYDNYTNANKTRTFLFS